MSRPDLLDRPRGRSPLRVSPLLILAIGALVAYGASRLRAYRAELRLERAAAVLAAVKSGDAVAVKRLLAGGVDPFAIDPGSHFTLVNDAWLDASPSQQRDDHGVSPEFDDHTRRMLEALRPLVQAGADHARTVDERHTIAQAAATAGLPEVALRMLHADPGQKAFKETFRAAAVNHQVSTAETLLRDGDYPRTPAFRGVLLTDVADDPSLVALVRTLVSVGADVNARNDYGATPLVVAARHPGNVDIVRLLLAQGADPNLPTAPVNPTPGYSSVRPETPLDAAAGAMQPRPDRVHSSIWSPVPNAGVVRLLLHYGAEPRKAGDHGASAVHNAIWAGDAASLVLLLDAGADASTQPDGSGAVFYAAQMGDPLLRILLSHGHHVSEQASTGYTPLHAAAALAESAVSRRLLTHGANVNAVGRDGVTPLHVAAGSASPENVEVLLAHGARVDAADAHGRTPVCAAAASAGVAGRLLAAEKLLLAHGASLTHRDWRGQTPLHLAAANGHIPDVDLFLARGAAIDERDRNGRTPLMLAAGAPRGGRSAVVKLLLQRGANTQLRDRHGDTALGIATRMRNGMSVRALQAAER